MGTVPVAGPGQPVSVLAGHLLIQATPDDLGPVTHLAGRDGCGLVVTGKNAVRACRDPWREQFSRPVLIDRRRYSGNRRCRGTEPFTIKWLREQTAAGAAVVLTDSGYIGQDDAQALVSILDQSAAAGDGVVAVLPLHTSWLADGLKRLVAEVNAHAVPVALVLEHKTDPLGTLRAVKGLVRFLSEAEVPAGLLSTDVSGLGALAFGAQWSAIGMRSSLRHLYPVSKDDDFHRAPSVSALIKPLLSIVTVQKIADAWARTSSDPDWVHDIWTCYCTTCHGRTADWMSAATELEASAHTFELLADLRDGLSGLTPGETRQRSWTSKCHVAKWRYDELRLGLRVGWEPPGYLRGWDALWKGP